MPYRQIFDQVSTVQWAIAGTVGFILLCLLAFTLVHFRAGRGHEASRKTKHTRLEASYALVLLLFFAGYYLWTISKNAAERSGLGPPAVTVNVKGFRWCWRFTYLHEGVVSTGSCNDAVSRVNAPPRPTRPLLVVPTGEVVRFNLTSSDVVHGFWLPYLDFKMYVYPDHVNTFETRFTKPGVHVGRCAVFCGLDHYEMDFVLRIVPPGSFDRWLAANRGRVRYASEVTRLEGGTS